MYVEDRTVDVHIRRLRKALETEGHDKWYKLYVVQVIVFLSVIKTHKGRGMRA